MCEWQFMQPQANEAIKDYYACKQTRSMFEECECGWSEWITEMCFLIGVRMRSALLHSVLL